MYTITIIKLKLYLTPSLVSLWRKESLNCFVYTLNFELNHSCAYHVETALEYGTYELIPVTEEGTQEGEVNFVDLKQAPENAVALEQEGKPRSIT